MLHKYIASGGVIIGVGQFDEPMEQHSGWLKFLLDDKASIFLWINPQNHPLYVSSGSFLNPILSSVRDRASHQPAPKPVTPSLLVLINVSLKVEQGMKFRSRIPGMTADMGGQKEGHSKGMETYVVIETDESPEAIAHIIEVAEKACMAAQTVVNAIPVSTKVIRNGVQGIQLNENPSLKRQFAWM